MVRTAMSTATVIQKKPGSGSSLEGVLLTLEGVLETFRGSGAPQVLHLRPRPSGMKGSRQYVHRRAMCSSTYTTDERPQVSTKIGYSFTSSGSFVSKTGGSAVGFFGASVAVGVWREFVMPGTAAGIFSVNTIGSHGNTCTGCRYRTALRLGQRPST